jgi:hypothetical protein
LYTHPAACCEQAAGHYRIAAILCTFKRKMLPDQPLPDEIVISGNTYDTLKQMAKWATVLAVACIAGLLIFSFVFILFIYANGSDVATLSSDRTRMSIIMNLVMCIVAAGMQFYPIYALLRYSQTIRQALNTNDSQLFSKAMSYLKNMLKYTAILIVIGVFCYLIGIAGAICLL